MTQPLALIIEDDENLAAIFAEALFAAQFNAEVIQDGEIALARLEAVIPELVILDLHLPQVSGRNILKKIRSNARLANTRVILATADPIVAESLREDADVVLIKPISFSQLRDLAARLRPPSFTGAS